MKRVRAFPASLRPTPVEDADQPAEDSYLCAAADGLGPEVEFPAAALQRTLLFRDNSVGQRDFADKTARMMAKTVRWKAESAGPSSTRGQTAPLLPLNSFVFSQASRRSLWRTLLGGTSLVLSDLGQMEGFWTAVEQHLLGAGCLQFDWLPYGLRVAPCSTPP